MKCKKGLYFIPASREIESGIRAFQCCFSCECSCCSANFLQKQTMCVSLLTGEGLCFTSSWVFISFINYSGHLKTQTVCIWTQQLPKSTARCIQGWMQSNRNLGFRPRKYFDYFIFLSFFLWLGFFVCLVWFGLFPKTFTVLRSPQDKIHIGKAVHYRECRFPDDIGMGLRK